MFKSVKTVLLLGGLSGLLLFIGDYYGGQSGLVLAFGFAVVMNGVSYFFSDRIAVRMARAEPVDEHQAPDIHEIVRNLATKAGQPMPALYMSPSPQLNAFATGRNPKNAVVCVNRGLYEALTHEELEGVLAHELQHVYNRDILVGSVAATIAAAITMLARMAFWFGGGGRDREGGALGGIFMIFLAPLAAVIIRTAVTRSREQLADKTGAELTGNNDPRRLRLGGTPAETSSAFQHMYISAPFGGRVAQGFGSLFRTHPPIPERIARLEQMAREMGQLGPNQTIFG